MVEALHSPQRVLVIDDDEVMRDILSLVLGAEGHSVATCESGDAALRELAALPPHRMPNIVLTDLQMPGLAGAALAEQLRALCPPTTTLAAMSGSAPKGADAAAFDAFLLKPFTAEDVVAAVRKHADAPGPVAEEKPPAGTTPPLDEGIYDKLAATMSKPQLEELYQLCLDDALKRIGLMRTAATAGDSATFAREAHAIKGGCGMLGAAELHGIASRMETGALSCTPLLDEFSLAAERLRRMLEARS